VAWFILKAALEYPARYRERLLRDVERYGRWIVKRIREKFAKYYPPHPRGQPTAYIWVRVFRCPECGVEIPSLKSLWLDREKGYAVYPEVTGDKVRLHVVRVEEIEKIKVGNRWESRVKVIKGPLRGIEFETRGFVSGGKLRCPKHGHIVEQEEVKRQYKEFLEKKEAEGARGVHPIKLVAVVLEGREYDEPTQEIGEACLRAERALVFLWKKLTLEQDLIPTDFIYQGEKTNELLLFGIKSWYQLFTARQLLVHAEMVRLIREAYRRILKEQLEKGDSKEEAEEYARAVTIYLMLAFGKLLDYNSTLTVWHTSRGVLVHTFDSHAYAWTWDFGEFDMTKTDKSLGWCFKNVMKSLRGIANRICNFANSNNVEIKVLAGDAEFLITNDGCTDIVFIDPPYLDNIQYAELSEYFYVWFKRILRDIYPEVFSFPEVLKSEEAVANKVRHGDRELARRFYREKMFRIFRAVHRALRDDGVFLLWFAHRTGEAWSTTVRSLLDAGFIITAVWPVRSEMERSIHVSGKAALRTSMIVVCRKRQEKAGGFLQDAIAELDQTIENRLVELDEMGLVGPDFMMGAMAHALKVASERWPLRDPSGELSPEECLSIVVDRAVGEAVSYVTRKVAPEIAAVDAPTRFYVLARDLYRDMIPWDDARRLALACQPGEISGDPVKEVVILSGLGVETSTSVKGEKQKLIRLLDHTERAKHGLLREPKYLIDYVHKAMVELESGSPERAAETLREAGPLARELLRVLVKILPKTVRRKKREIQNPERVAAVNLLYSVYGADGYSAYGAETPAQTRGESLEGYLGG